MFNCCVLVVLVLTLLCCLVCVGCNVQSYEEFERNLIHQLKLQANLARTRCNKEGYVLIYGKCREVFPE
ncbi:unnamed protein product [Acanthoscelides obtectus]|uniref:Secreted protein n=1 Tax=Acanthoscelides obtectus TaxID=200917 RepID=A0A9P0P6D4_ACAOB|nr:unnamed protein product [Acanthoscelides obtectus]CAK1640890.1 hypothetical protein AOBTE_LOCUS12000 [Acanthoscelides obtectus]